MTYVLITVWLIGGVPIEIHEAAASRDACEIAAWAALTGFALPSYAKAPAKQARCVPGNLFRPGWDKIQGYNG